MTINEIHPITSLHPSCNACGLPANTCVCDQVPALKTAAQIWILSTEKELSRPSNTARLLKLMNPQSTEIHQWQRTREPEALLRKIRSGLYEPYLLFPADTEETCSRVVNYPISGKIPAFIIIDGTWQEARKIMRKSDYLKDLPLISLNPVGDSAFTLRRGLKPGNLCTLETAIEAVHMSGEQEAAGAMHLLYLLFLRSYEAGRCGHGLQDEGRKQHE